MAEVEYIWGPKGSCVVLSSTPKRCGRCGELCNVFVNDKRSTEWGGTVCGTCWLGLPDPEKRRQEVLEQTA